MARSSKRGPKEKKPSDYQDRICENLRKGMSRKRAAQLAGISEATFHRWMRSGKQSRQGTEKRNFYEAVLQAESELESKLVGKWKEEAEKSWQAAAALLAKRFPDEWGKNPITHREQEEQEDVLEFEVIFGGRQQE